MHQVIIKLEDNNGLVGKTNAWRDGAREGVVHGLQDAQLWHLHEFKRNRALKPIVLDLEIFHLR